MQRVSERSVLRYPGISLTTCSMLLLQVYLTRVFTVLFHSSFAFLAISIAFLGLGTAGVFAYLAPRLFPAERVVRRLPVVALIYSISVGAAFVVLIHLDNALIGAYDGAALPFKIYVFRVLLAGVFMVPSYFCVGLVLSVMFRHHVADISRLYFADLLGAGVGCLLVLPLLSLVGGDSAIFFICALAAAGTTLLAVAGGARVAAVCGAALLGLSLALLAVNDQAGLVMVRSHATNTGGAGTQRSREKAVRGNDELHSAWNSFSRIGVFETVGGHELYVRIDSSCQTSIPVLDEAAVSALTEDLTFERLPYLLDRHRRYLEIGAGGGAGMLTASQFGAERIVGVEINDITVDCAKRVFAERCGMNALFDRPGVDLVVDEGRSWVTHTDERFDTVTITFIQTGAASGATAFALSEANLFTVEAFTRFLEKLDDDGLFYVYRHGGNQMLRLISILRAAFRNLGVEDLHRRVFIVKDPLLNHAVLMASRRGYTDAEIATLEQGARKLDLKVLFSPGSWNDALLPNPLVDELRLLRSEGRYNWAEIKQVYDRQNHSTKVQPIEHAYMVAKDPQAFAADYFLDIRATTDNRPYFFFFSVNRLSDLWMAFQPAGLEYLGSIVVLLFYLLVAFTALVLILIVLPLFWTRRGALRGGGKTAFLGYFAILGVSYIAIEVSFIQRFALFLGHPMYAVSVVLMAFLVCTGVGSFCSDALFARGRLTIARTLILLVVLLLAYDQLLPVVFASALIGLPVAVKILISLVLIFPLAFLMGMLFPQGVHRVEQADPDLVPWVWGANSATSVVGSIFALILAIHLGFSAVLFFGAGLYLLALLFIRHRVWRTDAT